MRTVLLMLVLGLVACSSEMSEPLVYFTELPGDTCGELQPAADLSTVCSDFGGVGTLERSSDGSIYLECAEANAVLHWSGVNSTGSFTLVLDDCTSSYDLSYEPDHVLPVEPLVHDHK